MNFVEYIRMCMQNCALVALGFMLTATACIASWPILRAAWHDLKRGTFAALAALAAVCTICAQKTSGPSITLDALIRDAGCYATNDVFHVAATNSPAYAALDFSTSDVLVYARERGLTNATDWAELTPRRTFGDLPADYVIANATNYDYMVYLDYIPPSPVHTNGVFELRGFLIPGNGEQETGNGERAAGFINSCEMRDVPYTAEIEYLESSGIQHINALVRAASGWKIDISFSSTRFAGSAMSLFGARSSAASQDAFSAFTSTSGLYPQYDGMQSLVRGTATVVGIKHRLVMGEDGAFLDGVQIRPANHNTFTTPADFYLFKKNQNDNGADRPFYGRIYACSIWNDKGILVRDFIPVRKNGVGYMYDRVSGQLFGNQGTGAFILGPDK